MQSRIVGLYYRPAQAHEVVSTLAPGDPITLEREPENPHDAYAIRALASDVHIGYLPSSLAAYIEELPSDATFVGIEETEHTRYPLIEWSDGA